MKKILSLFSLILLLAGCRTSDHSSSIVSMQTVDRNGFSETISNKERLNVYQNVDFLASQHYRKALRVYGKDHLGRSLSKLTSYHSNGSAWQYLEAIDGRANGRYLEWHENGKVKIEGKVIEGVADLTENAQKSWLFDDECNVWDEEGNLEAHFIYSRGHLEGEAKYFFPSGKVKKIIPYIHGVIDGVLFSYDEQGNEMEQIHYQNGLKEGSATAAWSTDQSKYQEQYREGLLINAFYFDPEGQIVGEIENGDGWKSEFDHNRLLALIEYHNGIPDGQVKTFDSKGALQTTYSIAEGMRNGEEWEYYPSSENELKPRLMVTWFENQIQGMAKTWYDNGILESQREMGANKKHGLSFAYYKSGDLMLMEEYENDRLIKGSYYKKGEQTPVSTIEKGDGIATLYSSDGSYLKKVIYERSRPIPD